MHYFHTRLKVLILALCSASLLLSGCQREQPTPQAQSESNTASSAASSAAPITPVPDPAYYWVELGPDNLTLARAIMLNNNCPAITVDGTSFPMQPRGTASPPGFSAITVCEYPLPAATGSAAINQLPLALPSAAPTRIVVLGDTGCRVKGSDIQDCTGQGTGEKWEFAEVAASVAAVKPDLILHVGDYHYREYGSCDSNCIQANIGYTWTSWQADFFAPAQTILQTTPWLFVRGNHEDCGRAWKGWFYLLDPQPLASDPWQQTNCPDYTDPYQVMLGSQQVIMMDTAVIPDDYAADPNPAAVTRYAGEFNTVEAMSSGQASTWLATHRPIWAVASFTDSSGNPAIAATDLTLQQAIAQSNTTQLPNPPVDTLLTGHIHLFEMLDFDDNRPTQLVFGGGATELDPGITDQLLQDNPSVLNELGITRQQLQVLHNISFGVLEKMPDSCGWTVNVMAKQGQSIDSFKIGC